MKIPPKPPAIQNIQTVAERYIESPSLRSPADAKGRYLHWDEVRRRPPPGLTIEQYWHCLKLARLVHYQTVPFAQTSGDRFVFCLTGQLQKACHEIDKAAGGNLGTSSEFDNTRHQNERYLINSLIEEAVHSSWLEGAAVPREDARKMLKEQRQPKTLDERMIVNNYRAISRIRHLSQKPLTVKMICTLHRILTAGILDESKCGRIRSHASAPDDFGVYDAHGALLYRPPHWQKLSSGLHDLCRFANQEVAPNLHATSFLHPLLQAIIVHFLLSYLHPFVDGNGRTARALFYWCMLKNGYWLMEYVSISAAIRRAPSHYSRAFLYTETDAGDLTYFLLHQTTMIQKAMEAFRRFVRKKQDGLQDMQNFLSGRMARQHFNLRQIELLAHAAKNPSFAYTVQSHQRRQNVCYQTARNDLLALAKLGLLHQIKAGKKFLFTAPANLEQKIRTLPQTN